MVDEVGEDALTSLQSQLVCHQLGNQNFVVACLVVKLRNASLHHVLVDEGGVPFRSNALETHSEEVFVSLEDTFLHGESLHVFHTRSFLDDLYHGVVHHHWVLVHLLEGHEVGNLDMASETYHLVTDGMLESQDHTDGDDHDGKTDGDTRHGNMNSRARNFTFVALIAV